MSSPTSTSSSTSCERRRTAQILPPSAEEALAHDDPAAVESAAASHPERQDVRMAVLVTREGGRICAVRLRSHDVDDEVLVGEDIVPRLADALAATLT